MAPQGRPKGRDAVASCGALAADIRRLYPGFLLPQYPDGLFFREPAAFQSSVSWLGSFLFMVSR